MKKIILVLVALIGFTASAQTDSTKVKTSKYVAVGLSMANANGQSFDVASYPSVEFGVTRNSISYALVLGRGQLRGLGQSGDVLSDYYWEVKVSPSFDLGVVSVNPLLGGGSMFDTDKATFIEYGVGISKTYGKFTYGMTYSNWAGTDYVTPSVSYGF